MLTYALTAFLSAVLLFQVQPIIAKAILPWFGGSAAVWTACMLFFQVALLAGYSYAHLLTTKLRLRTQVLVHCGLVALSLLLLPVAPNAHWRMAAASQPALSILALLATSVGIPYFLLSTTSPLLQAWYATSRGAAPPYRLFSISNAASLIGLLAYPLVIEPALTTRMQLNSWSIAYGVFAAACIFTGLDTLRRGAGAGPACTASEPSAATGTGISRFALWITLPACASTLMLAVTNSFGENVAPLPFLWILPLACYLLSFVICFGSDRWYPARFVRIAIYPALAGLAIVMLITPRWPLLALVGLGMVSLLVVCVFLHGELYRMRPEASGLTAFYFSLSVGGALGGLYVGLLAPAIYPGHAEVPIGLLACGAVAVCMAMGATREQVNVAGGMVGVLSVLFLFPSLNGEGILHARNFYSALRVSVEVLQGEKLLRLDNGATVHGLEYVNPAKHLVPTTYYASQTAIGKLLLAESRPLRVGVVGLGAATLASYAKPGDVYRMYELNPLVLDIARSHFFFLKECRGTNEVILGDARISMEREQSQNYDILALDAFSGHSIPLHLLTEEAFRLYFRHLRAGGTLAVHISNRHLDLAPVIAAACLPMGKQVRVFKNRLDINHGVLSATWVVVPGDPRIFERPEWSEAKLIEPAARAWTDDYSNLLQVLRW